MIILKSLAVGLLAVLATAMTITVLAIVALLSAGNHREDTIGWDPVAFARAPLAWIIFLLAFAGGFYWQYRRIVTR
jgi:hypothetical protein